MEDPFTGKALLSNIRDSRSPRNFATTQIYCPTAYTLLFVHLLPDKRFECCTSWMAPVSQRTLSSYGFVTIKEAIVCRPPNNSLGEHYAL
jgi:hypothetical protein